MARRFPRLAALALVAALLPASAAAAPLVFAAASLADAIEEAADAWAGRGHAPPRLSFAASSVLARQIALGAPADLFVSANAAWMDRLAADGRVAPGSRRVLATNRLVLVAPAAAAMREPVPLAAFDLAAALGEGRLAVALTAAVPAGIYARQALEHFGVWGSVSDRLAEADNVRAALALVERAEAPLGIVYATDAAASSRVRVVATVPSSAHAPIVYPAALVGDDPEGAAFLDFLAAEEARAIFRRHGFGVPPGGSGPG
ncbi:MAG: molybdate ABC transporter substrate-binding protein [Paracoccaceae bacterium]